MPSRSRSRDHSATSGGYVDLVYNGTIYSHSVGYAGSTWHETCDDTTDSPPFVVPHPLVIQSYKASPPMKLNGDEPYAPLPILVYQYRDYTVAARSGYSYCEPISPIVWAYWQTKALASLNPSAPSVDILNFIYEFKDLPEMLKNFGHVLSKHRSAKDVVDGHLAYSFGWKPLISDLRHLWNLTQEVEDRCAYLRKLEAGTYIRRSLGGGIVRHDITSNGLSIPDSGSGFLVRADVDVLEQQKVWFTCNAKLLNPLPDASKMRSVVRNLLLGLDVSAAPGVVWNAIPWTWLIDYFANMSDFMTAQRGSFILSIPSMCIMARSDVTSSLRNIRVKAGFSCQGGRTLSTIAKQRHVVYQPVPWLALDPMLSGVQMLNLGSLILSRALGSSGRLAK